MSVPDASPSASRVTVTTARHANPMGIYDAPLIHVTVVGEPDPVTAAIARNVGESGSAYLELPDGRLVLILDLADWLRATAGSPDIAD
jgi:hypothetical protein